MTVILKPASDLKKTSRLSVDVANTVRPVLKAFTKQSGVIREIPLWVQQEKLLANDREAGDLFGQGVSISGDYVIVGASEESSAASDAGAAYIFARSNLSWSQQAKLLASDAQSSDRFGGSVSISSDYAVVGAADEDAGGLGAGAVYVFVRSGTNWTQQAKLLASDTINGLFLGVSVGISGDYIVAGAPGEATNGSSAGAAYVFIRSGTNWTQQAKLLGSDTAAGDRFGASASISGDYVILGAPERGEGVGAAYVFVRSGTNWTQQAKLVASDAQSVDRFASSVSISGNYAVVGAPGEDAGGSSAGAAYVFIRSGTNWTQQAKLVAADAQAGDLFGRSVGISGDRIVVGADLEDAGGTDAGAAYIFVRSGTTWIQQAKLIASDAQAGDNFGISAAISGDYVVVGASDEDTGGTDAGAAYVF